MEAKKRLIDANLLKQKLDEREAEDVELYGCSIPEGFCSEDAKEVVDKMPTVDAIPASWLHEKLTGHPEISYSITDSIIKVLNLWEMERYK